MERHVIIFATKYVIITKHVSNTNTRGVNGFSAICFHKSRVFSDEKRNFRGSVDFRTKKERFPREVDFRTKTWISARNIQKAALKDQKGPEGEKEAFITLSPSRVETRCLSSYGPLHST
jgi:hypothetical protein